VNRINDLKRRILNAAFLAKEGHVASAFSVLDILYVLYENINFDPERDKLPSRDFVFLSKGHASLALYAVLADKGLFSNHLLARYCQHDSFLGGHPHRLCVPGVEASTGSLGHGLPMAVGCAMSLANDKEQNRVYCIVGDGELNEGSCWESLMLAAHHKLCNLTLFIDYNGSNDRAIDLAPLRRKLLAFGWPTEEIDGHDHEALKTALCYRSIKPTAIICRTVKGKGVKEMEENPHAWHHRTPTREELDRFIQELP